MPTGAELVHAAGGGVDVFVDDRRPFTAGKVVELSRAGEDKHRLGSDKWGAGSAQREFPGIEAEGATATIPLTPRKLDGKVDESRCDAVAGVFSSLRRLAVAGGRFRAKAVARFPVSRTCEAG